MHYRTTRRQAWRALLAAAVAVAALPSAAARAAEVTADGTEIIVEDKGGFMVVPQHNRLIAEALPTGELRLVDQVPLVANADTCLNVNATEVRCVRPSNSPITKLVFQAGGGNDQLRPSGSLPMHFQGGDGDDLYVGARTDAPTRVDFQGGFGDDLAHYLNANTRVHVAKDEIANDGRLGDGDNIRKDVDVVVGTRFGDQLSGMVSGLDFEEFRPLGGDDVITGVGGITTVDMGSAADGADKVIDGNGFTIVSYQQRTKPLRVGAGLADGEPGEDGETGENDEIGNVDSVVGGTGDDTLYAATDRDGISLDGGPGNDKLTGARMRDRLTGGLGRDLLIGHDNSDTLIADEGDIDRVHCGSGVSDVAFTDTAEEEISGCETRNSVGTLRLTPKVLRAEAGQTARLKLRWRHPTAWKQLRKIELRLTYDGAPVGEVTIRPRGERIAASGAVQLDRAASRVSSKGKAVHARLAIRPADGLGGKRLKIEVEATDMRSARQLERAGALRVAG